MGNMLDYLRWRGDLSLVEVPFCAPDNLILSYLAYVNLDEIAPAVGEPFITVEEASRHFFRRYTKKELKDDRSFIHRAPYVMQEMAKTNRFAKAKIGNYVNMIEVEKNLQFAALEIRLEDQTSYVAFRGTDDTIVGWKEDFHLSNGTVPAQLKSVEYMNRIGEECPHKIRVGGHSKGGNLCIYAAARCSETVQNKIIKVYSNDGPGFTEEFFAETGYQCIKDKIIRIVPEFSVIGMLFLHEKLPIVIESSEKNIMQHDGLSWEIMGGSFVKVECLSPKVEVFNKILSSWITDMDETKREELISNLFSVLEVTGAQTLTDIQNGNLKDVGLMLEQLKRLDAGTKETMDALVDDILKHLKDFF